MATHTHHYDFTDKTTLKCTCGSHMVVLITNRARLLHDLAAKDLLTKDGKAWREATGTG